MTRKELLEQAANIVTGHRESDYGSPENSFAAIAELWSYWLGVDVTAYDVGMMMILLKVARIREAQGRPTDDSFVDLAGYAACTSEILDGTQNEEAEPEAAEA